MSELMLITGHKARTAPGGTRITWALPESLEIDPLLKDLENRFRAEPEKNLKKSRVWYDTDDWRLYGNNMLLFNEYPSWYLMHRDTGKIVATFSGKKSAQFRFSWDFPVTRMRSLLEPVLSVRTLLPLVRQDISSSCHRILNKDKKTVAFVYVDGHTTSESDEVFRSVTVKGVRGYERSFKELSVFFSNYGISHVASPSAALDFGIKCRRRFPLDYTSKFSVALQPKMSAFQAMVVIYKKLLATIEHNVDGIINDLDTEFLHDFRVAIRRTRSGFAQVKDVLPAEVVKKEKKDFSWLGTVTGATRDLDVYLLDRKKYMDRLPENLRPYLEYFFVDIAAKRKIEQQKLVANLRSDKFRQIISRWHEYLHGKRINGDTANAGRPVIELAREIVFRKYKKVIKDGGAIKRSSPDRDLHRLRIQCKKLRYTLEFFSSLFHKGKMKLAIKQLKRLQDNLGMFNDLSVQQDMLQEYLAGVRPGSKRNQHLSTAIGGLLTNLHHEQQRVRKEFYNRFHQFSCEENQQLYSKLFH